MKRALTGSFACLLLLLLLLRPAALTAGVQTGLTACASTVIPSLFPFSVAAALAMQSSLPQPVLRVLAPLMRRLRQPPESAAIVLLALLGGYPVGAQAIGSAVAGGRLTREQAARLQCVCVNAGFGFPINAVGAALLGTRSAGRLLFIAVTAAALLLLPACRLPLRGSPAQTRPIPPLVQASPLESVAGSARAMLTVCGLVALFSGLGGALESCALPPAAVTALCCLTEVTTGCLRIAGRCPLPLLAAVIAFGGLCVHLQVAALAGPAAPPLPRFYSFRAAHAALAAAITAGLQRLFPQATAAIAAAGVRPAATPHSVPAAVSLLFLIVLMILDLDRERKIC